MEGHGEGMLAGRGGEMKGENTAGSRMTRVTMGVGVENGDTIFEEHIFSCGHAGTLAIFVDGQEDCLN